ncbi:CDP-alcohol phosphatidyltransferase family protein [Thorsellia kenyensis]|uniref:CDP-alcohol phosphatidyltransferase family protein n=1 Tax=Thorsellia kenyensis TaxID=1549888 RepID=A0ABV6CAP2_9GAMM
MLDAKITPKLTPLLTPTVKLLINKGIKSNQITIVGFIIGLMAAIAISLSYFWFGLIGIMINRLCDGLDGALARTLKEDTPSGGFLDICLDFLFYASIPVAFAIASPTENALSAAILLMTFIGTGSSFLAFAIHAETFKLDRPQFAYKSFYYLNGLTEGTETILFFCAFCIFPAYFSLLALIFAFLASITIFTRIYFGFKTIQSKERSLK